MWTGDVDLNDGKIADQHTRFLNWLAHIDGICRDLMNVTQRMCTLEDLKMEQTLLHRDITFLQQCMFFWHKQDHYQWEHV